jgi:nucleoside-diphosphate-sugar epimerase
VRVLVTGHLGYLGARLVPLLRNAEIEVVGLDSGLFRDCAIAPPEPVPSIDKDIRDAEAKDVAGFDAVIHLAGFSSEELGHIHPALTFEVNFEASLRLAQLAKEAGVRRFLFASSTSVYGPGSAARGEGSPLAPETPYAVSKALAEEELARLAADSFCPVVLRTAHPYGLSPSLRFEPVLNHLVAQAAIDGCIRLEQPDRRFDLIHVEDVARAYLAALQAPQEAVHRQTFNLGVSGESYAATEIAGFVRETVPGAQIERLTDGRATAAESPAKFGKLKRLLPDFRPRWTARRGVVEILDAVGRLGLRRSDIEGARFGRVQHLKMLVRLGRMDDELRLVSPARLSAASGSL